jgi:protein involved in polysaccharide export with SLBB domain
MAKKSMIGRNFISWLLIFLIAMPVASWGQYSPGQIPGRDFSPEEQRRLRDLSPEEQRRMEEQAQGYLQRFETQRIPGGPVSGQLPLQQPKIPATLLAPGPPATESAKVLTTAPRQPEETSAAEKRAAAYGLNVRQYGYSFFYKPPETFLPVQTVPVGPEYVIGPGDTIRILIWGSVQGEYTLMVDNNGQIAIPKIGVIHVSGLTYWQLREVIDREFSRQFTNFQINVTLDNLRTIQVFVVGQARFPGSYAVSSLSTLISALFAAGGPSKSGSMRNIQVRRSNRVIAQFDMYDFLLRGDKSKDVRLMSQDVIFIPPIGPLAAIGAPRLENVGVAAEKGKAETVAVEGGEPAIGGPVKIPGIFELKNERTLSDLLNLGGGLADTAFRGRVQVLRIKNHKEMVLFEDYLEKVLHCPGPDIPLVDGDFVKIFRVPDVVEKKVRLAGAVKKPGEFGINDGMRVKDLIDYAGGLLMEANQQEAEITRVSITPEGPVTSRHYFNLRSALSGSTRDNILLRPNDYVFIRTVPDWALYRLVKIEGEVKFPGSYAIQKGETLSSLLSRAGGYTDNAYPKGTFFTREAVRQMQAAHLKQAIDKLEAEMISFASQETQTALGKEDVERGKITLVQQQQFLAKMRSIQPLGRVVLQLDDPERLRGTPDDLELQEGDNLLIPPIQQTVNVLGSVVNPTAVVYDPYFKVKNYIAQAGGPTKNADVDRVYVIKVNGSAMGGRGGILFGSRVGSARLDPGDTIVVPEQLDRVPWLKTVKDVATIVSQIALTAGVVLVGLK